MNSRFYTYVRRAGAGARKESRGRRVLRICALTMWCIRSWIVVHLNLRRSQIAMILTPCLRIRAGILIHDCWMGVSRIAQGRERVHAIVARIASHVEVRVVDKGQESRMQSKEPRLQCWSTRTVELVNDANDGIEEEEERHFARRA